jgi:hypothetical protein
MLPLALGGVFDVIHARGNVATFVTAIAFLVRPCRSHGEPKAAARWGLAVSAGCPSPSPRGLWGGDDLLLSMVLGTE